MYKVCMSTDKVYMSTYNVFMSTYKVYMSTYKVFMFTMHARSLLSEIVSRWETCTRSYENFS
jgi:hypothetical protein